MVQESGVVYERTTYLALCLKFPTIIKERNQCFCDITSDLDFQCSLHFLKSQPSPPKTQTLSFFLLCVVQCHSTLTLSVGDTVSNVIVSAEAKGNTIRADV